MNKHEGLDNLNELEKDPYYDLIFKKFFGSRFSVKESIGMENLHLAGKNLYASFYHPEMIDGLIRESETYPDRIDVMKQKLPNIPKNIPSEEEFVNELIRILEKDVDYENAIFQEAKKQFSEIMKLSEQTIVWTEGDNDEVDKYPKSREQLYKIFGAKFFSETRQQLAKEKRMTNSEALSIKVSGNKMELVPEILKSLEEKQIDTIVLVEDRLANIIKFMEQSESINVFPVWVRQSDYKDNLEEGKTVEECKKQFNAIDKIDDLLDLLNTNNVFEQDKKVASIFDMDGVLLDDEKRREFQINAIIKRFRELGWI